MSYTSYRHDVDLPLRFSKDARTVAEINFSFSLSFEELVSLESTGPSVAPSISIESAAAPLVPLLPLLLGPGSSDDTID